MARVLVVEQPALVSVRVLPLVAKLTAGCVPAVLVLVRVVLVLVRVVLVLVRVVLVVVSVVLALVLALGLEPNLRTLHRHCRWS